MSSLFTNYFGIQNAKNFERFVTSIYGNTYITIGKSTAWPDGDDPPVPNESANTFYNYWDNVVGLKKITAADMNLVIPRVDWDTTGQTIYTAYTEDLDIFKKTDPTQIPYDYKFYVRNNRDQVFKCLANTTITSSTPVRSTIMPEITIGGQLPENPFIQTSDGYKWKYMYTIPPGLKEKFFTKQYMPIHYEAVVTENSVDGRLDIFRIIKKGSGYNGNLTASSLGIGTILGDGTGAKITLAVTSSGTTGANVTGVNIISGGTGYTKANVAISDPIKTALSEVAIIQPIIGPPGGHGSDNARELGAANLMISVDIEGSENDVLPLAYNDIHGIRQIGILLDPLLAATGKFASDTVYRGTTKIIVTDPNVDYVHQQIVYCGKSLETATFRGIVEHYDAANKYVYVTSNYGKPTEYTTLYGVVAGGTNETGALSSILAVEQPDVKRYSGKLLYIEDTSEINRTQDQITRFKFTLRF